MFWPAVIFSALAFHFCQAGIYSKMSRTINDAFSTCNGTQFSEVINDEFCLSRGVSSCEVPYIPKDSDFSALSTAYSDSHTYFMGGFSNAYGSIPQGMGMLSTGARCATCSGASGFKCSWLPCSASRDYSHMCISRKYNSLLGETTNIISTGLQMDDELCGVACGEEFKYGRYSAIFNGVCFCGTMLDELDIRTAGLTCDILANVCPVKFKINQLGFGMYNISMTSHIFNISMKSANLTFETEFNNPLVEYTLNRVIIGNGDQLRSPSPLSTDKTVQITTKKSYKIEYNFPNPGTYTVVMLDEILPLNRPNEDFKEFVHVHEDSSGLNVSAPSLVESGVPFEVSFTLERGTDVSVDYLARESTGAENTTNFVADVWRLQNPTDASIWLQIRTSSADSVFLPTKAIIIFPFQLVMKETGFISNVEVFSTKAGPLRLQVYDTTCTGDCSHTISLDSSYKSPHKTREPKTLKKSFDISVDIGYNNIYIKEKIEVLENDVIGIPIGSNGTGAYIPPSGETGNLCKVHEENLDASLLILSKCNILIRVSLTKPFTYKDKTAVFHQPGEATFIVKASSRDADPVTVTKTVLVQERITGYQLSVNLCLVNQPCTVAQSVTTGSMVKYNLTAHYTMFSNRAVLITPELIGTVNDAALSENFLFTKTGEVALEGIAYNLINNMSFQHVVIVDEPVSEISLEPSQATVFVDQSFTMQATFKGGFYLLYSVTVTDPSGAVTNLASNVQVNTDPTTVNFTHSYPTCGPHTYKLTVTKDYGQFGISNPPQNETEHTMVVACLLSGLKAFATPPPDGDGNIEVTIDSQLQLDVTLQLGSNVKYNITWGDGQVDVVDHSTKNIPEGFTVNHVYTSEGNFSVSVVAFDELASLKEEAANVTVSTCPFPTVEFTFGTEEEPMTYTLVNSIQATARWVFPSAMCEGIQKPSFGVNGWVLEGNNVSDVSQIAKTFDADLKKATYEIPKQFLSPGSYKVTLKMELNGKVKNYYGYFNTIEELLFVEIKNGVIQSVPYYITKADGNATYLNFTVDGSGSYDPGYPELQTQGIDFSWECKVISPEAQVNMSVEARLSANVTLYEHTMCLSPDWTNANLAKTPLINFNTEMFLENITYSIKLTITKGARSSTVIQELRIVLGNTPVTEIICFKCKPKLNIQERTIFKYECKDCGNRELEAVWEVSSPGEPVWTDESKTTTGFKYPNLVIRPDELKKASNYTFLLRIRFKGKLGQAVYQFNKQTGATPHSGICTVNPKEGTIMSKYRIRCSGWKNLDLPTVYEFRYDDGAPVSVGITSAAGVDYPILNSMSLNSPELLDQTLPGGLKENDYKIQLKLRIINNFGQYVQLDGPDLIVKVAPIPFADLLKTVAPVNTTSNATSSNTTTTSNEVKKSDAEQFDELMTSIQPADPNNAQEVTSIVLMKVNILSTAKEKTDGEAAVPTVVDPITGLESEEGAEEKLKKQEEAKAVRQKQNTDMLKMISNVTISNPLALKSLNDAVAAATSDPDELSDDAKDTALSFFTKSSESMLNLTKTMTPVESEQVCKSLLTSMSNVMESEVKSTKTNTPTQSSGSASSTNNQNTQVDQGTAPDSANATKKKLEDAKKLVGALHNVLSIIDKNQVPGEVATKGKTKAFDFNVQKVTQTEISNKEVNGIFVLPKAADLFKGKELGADISIQNVNYESNIFVDGDTSKNVKSKVSALALSLPGEKLKIKDTKEPFIITLENKVEDLQSRNVDLLMPEFVKYESIKVDPYSCSFLVQLNLTNDFQSQTKLIVYVQYGVAPSSDDYEVKMELSNEIIHNGSKVTDGEYTNFVINSSYVKIIDTMTFIMWNLTESRYYGVANKSEIHVAFKYEGPMPEIITIPNIYTFDIKEEAGSFNYSMKSFCAECSYWNENLEKWTTDGCQLSANGTTMHKTTCMCNHLTNFGSYFVAPNPLPTPSLALLKEGYVLLVTVMSMLLIYIIGLVFARRGDKADLDKIGVYPLVGNRPEDKYLYKITVNTGTRREAGTASNIYFTLSGALGESGIRLLKDVKDREFKRGSSLVFVMSTEDDLGDLAYLRIWHDNSGGDWYLKNIEVEDLQTDSEVNFIVTRWLAIDKEDGALIRIVHAASDIEMKNFNYLFTNHARQQLSDTHIWFSVYARPPNSHFTRCQRLSVAISLLFTCMLANIMFYGAVPPATPETANNVRGFTFTIPQIMVGVQSAFITVPVNVLLVALFKLIMPKRSIPVPKKEDKVSDKVDEIEEGLVPTPDKKKNQKKKKKMLPSWVLYPTWGLCVLTILGCSFMVVWYGMAFGNAKSLEWLGSVSVGLLQDWLLMQPLKVLLMGFVVAIVIKKLEKVENHRLDEELEECVAEMKTPVENCSIDISIFDRDNTDQIIPPDCEADVAKKLRKYLVRQQQMKAIVKEVFYYMIYAAVIVLLGYSLRDYSAYYQTHNLETMFKVKSDFLSANKKATVWTFIEDVVLKTLYPGKWYDIDKKWENDSYVSDFPGLLYLDDSFSKIVTGARLRQVRVEKDSCKKHDMIKNFTRLSCADFFSMSEEETGSYDQSWSRPKDFTDKKMTTQSKPWRYQKASEMDGIAVEGEIGLYSGGGYAVEIFPKWNNKWTLENLKNKLWIDRYTRALFIEFAIINTGTNYFDSVIMLFEFPPYGGVLHFHNVITFRVTSASNDFSFLILLAEIAFLIFTVLFIVRESRLIYRYSFKVYIKSFWNIVEVFIVLLCFVTIGLTFAKEQYRKHIVSRLPDKSPNVYINFQLAAYLDQILTYVFALICFFIVLKFVKLLQFNKRISMLARTLKRCTFPLGIFGVQFMLILLAFTLSGTLAFGKSLYGYRDNWSSFASVFRLILGKFDFTEFKEATNPVLGPLWFNLFNLTINFIVMNMYISILDDSMNDEISELADRENDHEMIEYVYNNLMNYLGMNSFTMESSTVVSKETLRDNLSSVKNSKKSLTNSSKSLQRNDTVDPLSERSFNEVENLTTTTYDDEKSPSPSASNKEVAFFTKTFHSDSQKIRSLSVDPLTIEEFGKYESKDNPTEDDILAAERFIYTMSKVQISKWK